MKLSPKVMAIESELLCWRRYLHAHAELSFSIRKLLLAEYS